MSQVIWPINIVITILDPATSTITYVGQAVPGSTTSAAVWQIQRIDQTTGIIILYAGDAQFDQVWDNRASLSYS